MVGCRVVPLFYDGSGISTLGICAGGVDGYCGMAMLNMVASCLVLLFVFLQGDGWVCMWLDGAGLWSTSVRSDAACVTSSAGDRIGNFFYNGNISVVSELHFDAVLVMYDVIHRYCIIYG